MADPNSSNIEQEEETNVGEDENADQSESIILPDDGEGSQEGDEEGEEDVPELAQDEDVELPDDALTDEADQLAKAASDVMSETESALTQGSEIEKMAPEKGSRRDIALSEEEVVGRFLSEEDQNLLQTPVSVEETEVSTPQEEVPATEEESLKEEEEEAVDKASIPDVEEAAEKAEAPLDVQPTVTEAGDVAVVEAGDVAVVEAGDEAVVEAGDEAIYVDTSSESEESDDSEGLVDLASSVTVKASLLPHKEMVAMSCTLGETIRQIKERFWKRMKVEPSVIKIKFCGELQMDDTRLVDLGAKRNRSIDLEVESRDPEHFPLKSFKRESYVPDILTINIVNKKGEGKEVAVEVLQPTRTKPFLGGFRHKTNRVEYFNASSQTKPVPLHWPKRTLFTRDTQTKQLTNQKLQTPQDTSTQMTKIGCYVSVAENRLHTPGKYITSKEKEDVKLAKVIILQTYIRRHLAWKYVMKVRKQKEARLQFEKDEALKRQQEKEDRIKAEFLRRQCPRSRKDFNTLYDALEKWRLQEIAKINETLTGAERKAALYMLLNQEMEHLAAIGRHQAIADEIIAEKNIESFLNKTAAPRSIISSYDNQKTLIDTPYTIRARELQEIYNSLIVNNFTLDERLDILLTLKYTIREHDYCKMSYELTCLVDREADLLMRGVSNNNLAGLRKRIATLFLQYIKTPIFNPEAARYTTLPPLTKKQKVYYCASCNKFYSSNQFPLNVNAQVPGPCKMCKSKDNEGRLRRDFNIYRYMLKSLRSREERYKDNSTIAFLLQDSDICYLVEKIWNSESIISNCNDLYELIWVRWNKDEVWTPWNCLLVTFEEAEMHSKLEDLNIAYGEVFVNKVLQKHLSAKSHFSRLPWLERQINQPKDLGLLVSQKRDGRYLSKNTSCNLFPSG
ncbi:Hypothetical predicted protein [Octopus vulgaris]|uniref:Ubiquitin-like domain-containing protein n=1 Tax=Octopus vulgaris TaxID=6645 RepID=A0AA36F9N4_OCTVU|nr:Hypothetical predicted protein [Octopus vulgaris]